MKKLIVLIIVLLVIISATIKIPKIRIVCLGDSITKGYMVSKEDNWVSLLGDNLGDDYKTINYGLTSRTLLSTGDYPYMNENKAKRFWNKKEDIVIIMLGTNDTKSINWDYNRFEKEYKELIDRLLKEKPNEKIYIMIPPKIFTDDISIDRPNNDNLEDGVIPIINELKDEYKEIKVIDLYTITNDHSELFIDGIHPNEEGHKVIANEIYKVIERGEKHV